jgi:hypothetical protein
MKQENNVINHQTESTYGFPQLAPLTTPLVHHLLARQEIPLNSQLLRGIDPRKRSSQVSQQLSQSWRLFERRVYEKRQHTYSLMAPAIQTDCTTSLSYVHPRWFRETLGLLTPSLRKDKTKEHITGQTLSTWRERNLLRHHAWGQCDVQSAAGLLIARQLDDTRERGWLPSMIEANEPHWWCYSQAAPVNGVPSPIVPCPVPLPADLPPATLLWTPWAGAGWDLCWLQIGLFGAIRWAGATLGPYGHVQWDVSAADLKQWAPDLFLEQDNACEHTQEVVNSIAKFVLLRLALTQNYFPITTSANLTLINLIS